MYYCFLAVWQAAGRGGGGDDGVAWINGGSINNFYRDLDI